MNVFRGKPVLYDLYDGNRCYHVNLFGYELETLTYALDFLYGLYFNGEVHENEWTELDRDTLENLISHISYVLVKVSHGNVLPTGTEVRTDE